MSKQPIIEAGKQYLSRDMSIISFFDPDCEDINNWFIADDTIHTPGFAYANYPAGNKVFSTEEHGKDILFNYPIPTKPNHTFVRPQDLRPGLLIYHAYKFSPKRDGRIIPLIVQAYPSRQTEFNFPEDWMDVLNTSDGYAIYLDKSLYFFNYLNYESLHDAGIIDNTYNLHRAFFTYAEAEAYINDWS